MNRNLAIAPPIALLIALAAPFSAGASLDRDGENSGSASGSSVRVEPNRRMLTLAVKGDPDRNGDSAMQVLLRQFFRGAGEAEKNAPVRPRVRWLVRSRTVPRAQWEAVYAVPVSDGFGDPAQGPAAIAVWRYGLIAESAYTGPYAGARAAVDDLKDGIRGAGFIPCGELEEEFVEGRGTLYQGDPDGFRTLIRFRVRAARLDP